MFVAAFEFFLIDDDLEYDVFEFDSLCYTANCLITSASESISFILLLN